jgi:hypothetical protein
LPQAGGDSVTVGGLHDLLTSGHHFKTENDLMSKNEGMVDRALRVILGLVLLSLVFTGPQTMWGLIGIVPLVTGLVGICPLYSILGIKTCSIKNG